MPRTFVMHLEIVSLMNSLEASVIEVGRYWKCVLSVPLCVKELSIYVCICDLLNIHVAVMNSGNSTCSYVCIYTVAWASTAYHICSLLDMANGCEWDTACYCTLHCLYVTTLLPYLQLCRRSWEASLRHMNPVESHYLGNVPSPLPFWMVCLQLSSQY